MAQQKTVYLVDDIDGSTGDDVATVEFSLDGQDFLIDLSDANAARLRQVIGQHVAGGARWVRGRKLRLQHSAIEPVPMRPRTAARPAGAAGKPDAQMVREWAQANGIHVAARGRIPKDIEEQYRAAQGPKRKRTKR